MSSDPEDFDFYLNDDFSEDSSGCVPSPEPELLTIRSNDAGMSSTMALNLSPYIRSFEDGDERTHQIIKEELTTKLTGVQGQFLWDQMLDTALAAAHLSPEQRLTIDKSPMTTFMKDGFVEIVKNAVDETILAYYESKRSPELELTMALDFLPSDCIALTITDTGRGFPSRFLEKQATPEARKAYIMEIGSPKTHGEAGRPALLGGAGLGLRQLAASIEFGGNLEGPGRLKLDYEKPAVSQMELSNSTMGRGAVIRIVTSLAPLQEKKVVEPPSPNSQITLSPVMPRKKMGVPSLSLFKSGAEEGKPVDQPESTPRYKRSSLHF